LARAQIPAKVYRQGFKFWDIKKIKLVVVFSEYGKVHPSNFGTMGIADKASRFVGHA
jgi:hypothetical protein